MYYDDYDPRMSGDSYPDSTDYYKLPSVLEDSQEWVYSQEYGPIMPLDDIDFEVPSSEAEPAGLNSFTPAMEDRPLPQLLDRPGPPIPNRPGRPVPPPRPVPPTRPGRPTPPVKPGRPVGPQPDWSWNWGLFLPRAIFPASIARVRFYNEALRTPVQIYINNRLVVSNLRYLDFTRFYHVVPGRYRITIYRGNNFRNPVVDTWMTFGRNTSTTVTVAGSNNHFWVQTSVS